MTTNLPAYASVEELLRIEQPARPVYCVHPEVYRRTAAEFVQAFPGRTLYAVKANDHPLVIRALRDGGIQHFDCASLDEIETVRAVDGDATCYFMVPARLRGAAREAQQRHGVRHFLVDHPSGIAALAAETELHSSVVFARMAVSHASAMQDLSSKFGAPPADTAALLDAIAAAGAEPALAFNVGSSVRSPDAYRHAIGVAAAVLDALPYRLRLVDIGGGFPLAYPGFDVPPLAAFLEAVRDAAGSLPLAAGGELLAEPGRALAAPGLSAVVEVLLRKDDRLYLNDGMYGIFWELRFRMHERYPVRCLRGGEPLAGETRPFRLYGPTCDSTDVLPAAIELPDGIRPGDCLHFERIGAYSLSGRTDFNGALIYRYRSLRIRASLIRNRPTHQVSP